MSLFSRIRDNIAYRLRRASDDPPAVRSVYRECVKDYHRIAKTQGLARHGPIFIPELIPAGEKAVTAFLKEPYSQVQFFRDDQTDYVALVIQAGIEFAAGWHENAHTLGAEYVEKIIEEGPTDASRPCLRQLGLTDSEKEYALYRAVQRSWYSNIKPYLMMIDPRKYMVKAALAAYQLGISMILEKYGY